MIHEKDWDKVKPGIKLKIAFDCTEQQAASHINHIVVVHSVAGVVGCMVKCIQCNSHPFPALCKELSFGALERLKKLMAES